MSKETKEAIAAAVAEVVKEIKAGISDHRGGESDHFHKAAAKAEILLKGLAK